ncbi:PAS domain S-box protein [Cellulophaga sp. Hel_I_12]|uniref:PAS domain S-box protein n=1 Tax=Cellulophaga sp. Hel_I_12 TaxID=1249972 RepID=UPI000646638D|nr:PAS domain S-box protein [Cellulophaga sp. Hel_I_12]
MEKDNKVYHILIIEDNIGDQILIKEYLEEHILEPKFTSASTFTAAKEFLVNSDLSFDIILLDLSLPDKSGEHLIQTMLQLAAEVPVVILTGYTDMPLSIRSLHLGISDYLLKDDLTSFSLYKSLLYNIQKKKYLLDLKKSEKRYSDLFHLSPLPMWVCDVENHHFLDVNDAAIQQYGYSHAEFMGMKFQDIENKPRESNALISNPLNGQVSGIREGRHRLKNGTIIDVETTSNELLYNAKKSLVTLVNNVTEKNIYIKAVEEQNAKLKEIAWIQSHIVRAPLARIMGIVNLLEVDENELNEEQLFLFKGLINSAHELDEIIKDISSKTAKADI